jgi:hypothetical protein
MSGSSINLGLPQYVFNNIYEYGFNSALYLANVQLRGADTNAAFNYYSAVVAALNAIGGESVPAIPAFGAAATADYCYGLAAVPSR